MQVHLLFRALHAQSARKSGGLAVEHCLDLLERNTDELECHDLFQPLQFRRPVETVAGTSAPRPKQSKPIVVMQRAHTDAGERGEFLYVLWLVHQ
jgi:hypothetical protein